MGVVEWTGKQAAHQQRIRALIGDYLDARAGGRPHPVIDFLFSYYRHRPAQLLRWHPGYGVVLAGADEHAGRRGYIRVGSGVTADPALVADRRDAIERIAHLLTATASRPAQLSCFGLHEWAMVYRGGEVRHPQVPLRLGRDGTDAVIDSLELRCTHYDAFRFFSGAAAPRNHRPLSRATQRDVEQPGCLHAAMDLYRWCYQLEPLIGSTLTADCFELALDARELDMRAGPYDLMDFGYPPVRIETAAGRAEHVREQARIADRAADLRAALLHSCRALLGGLDAS